jgi:cytidylate kinase
MFRCLAWRWQQLDFPEEEKELLNLGLNTKIKMSSSQIWCNETDVTQLIRTEKVSELSSRISRFSVIRDIMKQKQQQLVKDVRKTGSHKVAVLEGRDIGTVVFPDADLKFFVDASLEIRAQRRVDQLIEKGEKADFESVYLGLKERDTKDRSRVVAPLQPAKDAIMINTVGMVIQEVLESMHRYIESIN